MSETDLQTTVLVEAIESQPRALSDKLAVAMRSIATTILCDPEVVRALAAAESLPTGLVIADESAASALVSSMKTVIDGQKRLDSEMRRALEIPAHMANAAKLVVEPTKNKLDSAKTAGGIARVAWQQEVRRRALAEEARLRVEADRAAREAAAQAAAVGSDDIPPPAEVAPVSAPRIITGGAARSLTQVRITPREILDDKECPLLWKALIPSIARNAFDLACRMGDVKRPEPGESVVWKGVRFEAVESAVNR